MESTKINGQIDVPNIPAELQALDQWVLWKTVTRDGEAKRLPLSVYNTAASSTDPKTWTSFDNAVSTYDPLQHDGIGFVCTPSDHFGCIELGGCRDPQTGLVADWAIRVVERLASYTEVSPSQTGLTILFTSDTHLKKGRKKLLLVPEIVPDTPAIEIFTQSNYRPVTGCVYKQYLQIEHRESELQGFLKDHWRSAPEVDVPEQDGRSANESEPVVVRSFAGIDASELESYSMQEPDWLVEDIFTIDESALVGARSKGCKTLQLTDLAVALVSGTKWMGHFEVPKRRKVLLITGEANYRRISKHIEKACKARGIKFADLKEFLRVEAINFPCLPSAKDQATIRADVQRYGFEVVIVDPLYRGLNGVDSARLSEMGSAIKEFEAACAPACMILSHHVVKSAAREYGQPPALEDMTGAGIAESCGQWWLIGRNKKYEWDGMHDLCVQFGGREGQGGGRRILFNEHYWTFQVEGWHEFTSEADRERQQQRDNAKRDAEEIKMNQNRVKILNTSRNIKTPRSRTRIRDEAGMSGNSFGTVFAQLVQEQTFLVRPYRDGANRIKSEGYILAEYAAEYDKIWNPQ